jgi:O-ureido-D-serine cyclo-ligase
LIGDENGAPVVLELELIEPSLFFPFAGGSAERFAAAVVRRAGTTASAVRMPPEGMK